MHQFWSFDLLRAHFERSVSHVLLQTKRFIVLFASVAILLTGHGLQLTLLPLRAEALGWAPAAIGITASAYFAGFLLGCFVIPYFVSLVGHIRVFSATTTLCGSALLIVAVNDSYWVWAGLRFLTGVGICGCYIIIESWLNAQTTDAHRGRTLAVYTMLVLGAMTLGQVLVTIAPPISMVPIVIGSILLSASIIPLTLTRVHQPDPPPRHPFSVRRVARAAPAAVGTTVLIGAATGVVFTLTPLATSSQGMTLVQTSQIMMALVIGGACIQFPAGRLSDHIDRRKVMVGVLLIGLAAAIGALMSADSFLWYLVAMFFLGGAANAIYPLCLSHANDRMPGEFLQVGTVVLLSNSIGAIAGPLLGSWVMGIAGYAGYFYFMLGVLLAALLWLAGCLIRRNTAAPVDAPHINIAKSSPMMLEFDPRSLVEEDAENADPEPATAPSPTAPPTEPPAR